MVEHLWLRLCAFMDCNTLVVWTNVSSCVSIIPLSCSSRVTCEYTLVLLVDYAFNFLAQSSKTLSMYCEIIRLLYIHIYFYILYGALSFAY